MSTSSIAVIGAGSWGTALAIHLARQNYPVQLWGRNSTQMQEMQKIRCNLYYLPDAIFPENLDIHTDLKSAVQNCPTILIAVPSHAFRETLITIKPYLMPNARIIWATKGLDPSTHRLLHTVVTEILADMPYAILTGPSFAKEVAIGLPTAITIATRDDHFAKELMELFHSHNFRVYRSYDVIGVQLGGAIKNVLAIAVGIADGLGLGANARSALITRGLAEMSRLGLALGGQLETFMGLAGLGDLLLTCTDNQSRNRRFGLAVGSGKPAKIAEKEIGQVVEGIRTTNEIYQLAQKHQIELPICDQVYNVVYNKISPKIAAQNLLMREPKAE